jgi:hypothetical protein
MMQKPNYYAVIPAEVRYSKKLTPNAKLLYAEITALCNMNGKCTANTNYFCKLYEVSRVSIQKWLKNLETNGYIRRVNTYRPGSKEILARVITLKDLPSKQKLTDNINTKYTNNINLTDSNNKRSFKKPSIIEIQNYCIERNNNIDCETFYDFYESKGWVVGKSTMKSWKACIRTWERRDLKKQTMSKIDSQINEYIKGKEYL